VVVKTKYGPYHAHFSMPQKESSYDEFQTEQPETYESQPKDV